MWFKRKRKVDPDSALTETLRSLQTLLGEEDDTGARLEPILRAAPPAEQKRAKEHAPGETISDPSPPPPAQAHTEFETAADGSNSTTTGFEVNFLGTGAGETPMESEQDWTDPFQLVDDQDTIELTTLEFSDTGNHDLQLLQASQLETVIEPAVGLPALDSIPVLNDIVFEPTTEMPTVPSGHAVVKEAIIETALLDLNRRLEQNNLASMDADQEGKLRRALSSILA